MTEPENLKTLAAQWIKQLKENEYQSDLWNEALHELRKVSFYVVPQLIEAIAHEAPVVQNNIQMAIYRMGPLVAPDIVEAIKHPNVSVRFQAATLLRGLASPEKSPIVDIIPAIITALRDPESTVRLRAAEAVIELKERGVEVVPALIEAFRTSDSFVRMHIVMALSCVGPVSNDVAPALVGALRDEDAFVRREAASALSYFFKDDAPRLTRSELNKLIVCLKHPEPYERRFSAQAFVDLAKVGAADEEVLPELEEAMQDDDSEVRHYAKLAVDTILGKRQDFSI